MYRYARNFNRYYPHISAADLKRMVRLYGGTSSMPKYKCIDFLSAAIADPPTVQKAIESLEPFELLSLALAKQMGGAIDYQSVGIGILASGCKLPPHVLRNNPERDIASHLITRGLFLNDGRNPGEFYPYGYTVAELFTDPRLLAHVGTPTLITMPIDATKPPAITTMRMPPTVVLEIITILQTVKNMGSLGITQKDMLRVNDVRKFQKAMQWPKGDLKVDGLVFRDVSNALLGALRYSDFLQLTDSGLILKKTIEEIAALSYVEQISALMNGFVRLSEWNECSAGPWRSSYTSYRDFRVALLVALTSLPLDSDDFYTIDEFDRHFYTRIGAYFSLGGTVHRFSRTYNKTAAQIKRMKAKQEAERREEWLQKERPWLTDALSSWLYYLGMVELGVEAGHVTSFRLTPLGKAVLHPELEFSVGQTAQGEADEQSGAWVVQPNFDVIVYLDRTTPIQLAFLEKHAERAKSQQYTAHYRLTRNSIYQGLESGTKLTELIDELENHAQTPLPQNVIAEIQEWAGLREQVVLHGRANLVEFATATARKKALQNDLTGTPIGDRFLLVTPTAARSLMLIKPFPKITYNQPLSPILEINENGQITLTEKPADLWIEVQLAQWADSKRGLRWQLTSASVAARIKVGAKIDELISFLNGRAKKKLPPLLELALRSWAGKANEVQLKPLVMLHSGDPTVLEAIQNSERLKPYYRGRFGQDILLFDLDHIKEVEEVLLWAGLKV